MTTTALSRPAPGRLPAGLKPLFSGWTNIAITAACTAITLWLAAKLYAWGWAEAVIHGDATACRAASGACWAFIADKFDFFVFGFISEAAHWRVLFVLGLIAAMIAASLYRAFWGRTLLITWVGVLVFAALFLQGDAFGLTPAPLRTWSGLVVTVWIAVVALATAYPLGLILALGRLSQMRACSSSFHRLDRTGPRRAADLDSVPRLDHGSAVPAGRDRARSARPGASRLHHLRIGLSRRDLPRRPAIRAQGPVRGCRIPCVGRAGRRCASSSCRKR